MALFRSESEEARASAWLGRILLARPVSFTFLTVAAFCVALVLAAFFIAGEYTRKARVVGVLAPKTGVVRIVAQQAGIVEDLRASEGLRVEEREPLFTLADPRARESLESLGSSVEARIGERRRALALQRSHADAALRSEQASIAHRASGIERELAQIDTELEIQARRLAFSRQGAERWQHLQATGFASPAASDREREQALEHESRLEATRRTRMALSRELAAVRMESGSAMSRGQAQLAAIDAQAAALDQERVERGAQHRIAVVAPVRGTVATVLVEPGQTVAPGATLATVLPADARLEAHLFAPSRSIGFLRVGQDVLLRYLAYPHQKFGSHTARVASIARNPLTPAELGFAPPDGTREPLYRIRIELDSQTITAYGRPEPLQPGMQVEADILLDRRRLVEWVFEPLLSLAGRDVTADVARLQFGLRRRLPVFLQTEAAECGLASLGMVACFHGHRVDLAALRRRFTVSLKGATLAFLMQAAGRLHLAPRPLRLELNELQQLRAPCILHWDMNHFVVLKSADSRGAVVHDPAFGVRRLSLADVSKHFTGIALELTPTSEFRQADERRQVRLRDLMGPVTGLKRSLAQVFILALALQAVAIVTPFYMQWAVDGAVVTGDRDLLTVLGLGFLMLAVIQVGIAALRSWVVLYLGTTLNLQWLANVFSHLLRLPVSYFERRHLGDVVSRFGAVTTIQRTLTSSFVEALIDGVMAVATLAMMLVYSTTLTAVALAAVAVYGVLRWTFYDPLRRATEEYIVHSAKQQSHFLETVRGVQSIKLFGRQEERRSRWLNLVVDSVNQDLASQKLTLGFRSANGLVFGVERVGIVWLGALLVLESAFSVGMLFAFVAYKEQFSARVAGLIDKLIDLRMLNLQGERLADIVLTRPEEESSTAPVDSIDASLEVRAVSFRYSDPEPLVLVNCSFTVTPGESVAVVGASGGGKTTLVKLMLGLLQPTDGKILAGGVDIQKLGIDRYRKLVGTVMQDDQLFAGSIADNISFFDPAPDHAAIEHVARMAAVHDDIAAMPMAYNTLIGDMGAALSGGQRQRILLARALYKKPRILFLDEATSALDVQKERAVNEAVRSLNLTRIIIAHRPETIASADRVIVLQGGKVAQDLRRVANNEARAQ